MKKNTNRAGRSGQRSRMVRFLAIVLAIAMVSSVIVAVIQSLRY